MSFCLDSLPALSLYCDAAASCLADDRHELPLREFSTYCFQAATDCREETDGFETQPASCKVKQQAGSAAEFSCCVLWCDAAERRLVALTRGPRPLK
jgi:hypothetical protein